VQRLELYQRARNVLHLDGTLLPDFQPTIISTAKHKETLEPHNMFKSATIAKKRNQTKKGGNCFLNWEPTFVPSYVAILEQVDTRK
jgi:hypothetical protein